jgi:CheY-like chemotaxis protein
MPPKLLVADDSVTIRRVIELTFADQGVEVIAVSNGRQAIERIERERPDVVLADVNMPERSGYEVAWFVKNNPHLAHVPVVLLSGAFEPVDDERAQEAGCRGVLSKPFEPHVVVRRVRDLLGESPVPAPARAETLAEPLAAVLENGTGGKQADRSMSQQQTRRRSGFPEHDGTESLDEYFDRLDSRYANAHPVIEPEPFVSGASAAPPEPFVLPAADVPAPRNRPFRIGSAGLPLADAFQALLSAEEGIGEAFGFAADTEGRHDPAPPAHAGAEPQPAGADSGAVRDFDAILERASRRIVEELASTDMRRKLDEIVREVAERVIREELQRSGGQLFSGR